MTILLLLAALAMPVQAHVDSMAIHDSSMVYEFIEVSEEHYVNGEPDPMFIREEPIEPPKESHHLRYMTILLLLAVLIPTALLAGVREGMIMIMPDDPMWDRSYPNVRGHVWFNWYHAIRILTVAGYAILGYLLISTAALTWEYLVTLCLMFFVAWEVFERCYNWSRWKRFYDDIPESVNFADVIKFHAPDWVMSAVRWTMIALLTGGMVWLSIARNQ